VGCLAGGLCCVCMLLLIKVGAELSDLMLLRLHGYDIERGSLQVRLRVGKLSRALLVLCCSCSHSC
jgi:hypothetical protein